MKVINCLHDLSVGVRLNEILFEIGWVSETIYKRITNKLSWIKVIRDMPLRECYKLSKYCMTAETESIINEIG